MSSFHRLLSFLDLSNVQELMFAGLMQHRGVEQLVGMLGKPIPLNTNSPLERHLDSRPISIVTLISHFEGRELGASNVRDENRYIIPHQWWQTSERLVFIFGFFSCSAQYLRSPEVRRYHSGALGFDGDLWIWSKQIEYFVKLLKKIQRILKSEGGITENTFARVLSLYSKLMTGSRGKNLDYMSLISLVSQSERLRFIPGMKEETSSKAMGSRREWP